MYLKKLAAARAVAKADGRLASEAVVPPDYSMKPGEVEATTQVRDFIECIS